MTHSLTSRTMVQVRLALMSDCGCSRTLSALERDARSSGLTGAEIDAALEKRSFEVRTNAAIAYACALQSGNARVVDEAHLRVLGVGWTHEQLEEFGQFVGTLTAKPLA
jgi:hypothetical protein